MRPADVRHLLLSFIPRAPSSIDTTRLIARLATQGILRTPRAVQKILHDLVGDFAIECLDTSKPFRWQWLESAPAYEFPPMNAHTALTLKLAYTQLKDLLPKSTLEQIKTQQRRADEVLKSASKVASWTKKIRVFPRGFNLLPPRVDRAVLATVYDALLEDRCFHVTYRLRAQASDSSFDVNPIALIVRGSLLTLVCTIGIKNDVRQLHLHRMKSAQLITRASHPPAGFNLDAHIRAGNLSFRIGSPTVVFRAIVTDPVAQTLAETPLSTDQTLAQRPDGGTLVEATLADTLELRGWIASYGPNIEVLAPPEIRDEIASNARKTAALYPVS